MATIYRPRGLTADSLKVAAPEFERVCYLVDRVAVGMATNKKNLDLGSVPLKAEYLKKVVGERYLNHLKVAQQHE